MVASQKFSADDRKAVAEAVGEAEKKTSAEIVPVVATSSDRYERAEDLMGLAASIVAVAATWTQFQRIRPMTDWEGLEEVELHLPFVLAVMIVGFLIGVWAAKGLPWLKRLAVSRRAMTERVLVAAHHAFDALHVRDTVAATGVVIYVSLFERRVCVWADRAVSAKIPESEWKQACELLTRALGEGKPREGFVAAIRKCGEVLAKNFPVQSHNVNQLSNDLRILD